MGCKECGLESLCRDLASRPGFSSWRSWEGVPGGWWGGGGRTAQLCPQASLMANCQAPRRPWLASHMSTVFLTLLCFPSFLGAAVFLCYAVWQVKPSDTCGPFRSLNRMYEAGTMWARHLEQVGPGASWLSWLSRYLVENTFLLFLASALLLAVIYLNIQVVKGQRKVICLLKEQIRNEGEDKIFLINRLHSVYEKKERSRAGRAVETASPTLVTGARDKR
ncbi:transmembrane channel-like protein 6 isoform X2 [Octodon degus]|uniref:Transmembrane channel-like protein 6 isoform X2 n=1 Tax=Octodon degus TaxID=10160 RepID=A0A6P6ECG5_OCTDE|nr:transmembrane channel-like protein 6 isoform X2 [Octodon degus]